MVYTVLSASKNSIIDRAEGYYGEDHPQPLENAQLEDAVRLLGEKGWKVKISRQSGDRKVVIMEKDVCLETAVPIKFVARRGRVVEQYFIPDSLIAQPVGMEVEKLCSRLQRLGFTQERVEPQEGNVCIYFFSAPR